jgi:hypothetical protein
MHPTQWGHRLGVVRFLLRTAHILQRLHPEISFLPGGKGSVWHLRIRRGSRIEATPVYRQRTRRDQVAAQFEHGQILLG